MCIQVLRWRLLAIGLEAYQRALLMLLCECDVDAYSETQSIGGSDPTMGGTGGRPPIDQNN